jgi:hypothetical protein
MYRTGAARVAASRGGRSLASGTRVKKVGAGEVSASTRTYRSRVGEQGRRNARYKQ